MCFWCTRSNNDSIQIIYNNSKELGKEKETQLAEQLTEIFRRPLSRTIKKRLLDFKRRQITQEALIKELVHLAKNSRLMEEATNKSIQEIHHPVRVLLSIML